MRGRTHRFLLWACLGAFGLTAQLCSAAPAGATTGSYQDPNPCSAAVAGGVCISRINVDYTESTLNLTMDVGKATNPTSDPNWNREKTFAGWVVAVDGNTTGVGPTFLVLAGDIKPGEFSGSVSMEGSNSQTCPAKKNMVRVLFSLTDNSYSASIPASCVGHPSSLVVSAEWSYSRGSNPVTAQSPFIGFCCKAIPGTASPIAPSLSSGSAPQSSTSLTTPGSDATEANSGSGTTATSTKGTSGDALATTGVTSAQQFLLLFAVLLAVSGFIGHAIFARKENDICE